MPNSYWLMSDTYLSDLWDGCDLDDFYTNLPSSLLTKTSLLQQETKWRRMQNRSVRDDKSCQETRQQLILRLSWNSNIQKLFSKFHFSKKTRKLLSWKNSKKTASFTQENWKTLADSSFIFLLRPKNQNYMRSLLTKKLDSWAIFGHFENFLAFQFSIIENEPKIGPGFQLDKQRVSSLFSTNFHWRLEMFWEFLVTERDRRAFFDVSNSSVETH